MEIISSMKIQPNQQAPLFKTLDFHGNFLDLKQLQGKKVYLAFERNAGCPVCNLRVHQLLAKAKEINNDATVILIYESTPEKMKEYLGNEYYPFHFVCDASNALYKLYAVERSWTRLMSSVVNGIVPKVMAGYKLFKKRLSQDGHTNTIPAEFIIDERGKVVVAHYGRYVGDHLPVSSVLTTLHAER